MINKIIFSTLIILTSCASKDVHRIVLLEDGTKGYAISCFAERENCEREAEKLCNNKYKTHEFIYKQSVKSEPLIGKTSSASSIAEDTSEEELISRFEMTVSCQSQD